MQLDDILKLLRWGCFLGAINGWMDETSARSTYLRQLRPSIAMRPLWKLPDMMGFWISKSCISVSKDRGFFAGEQAAI